MFSSNLNIAVKSPKVPYYCFELIIAFDKTKNWWFSTQNEIKNPKMSNSVRNGKKNSMGDRCFFIVPHTYESHHTNGEHWNSYKGCSTNGSINNNLNCPTPPLLT